MGSLQELLRIQIRMPSRARYYACHASRRVPRWGVHGGIDSQSPRRFFRAKPGKCQSVRVVLVRVVRCYLWKSKTCDKQGRGDMLRVVVAAPRSALRCSAQGDVVEGPKINRSYGAQARRSARGTQARGGICCCNSRNVRGSARCWAPSRRQK